MDSHAKFRGRSERTGYWEYGSYIDGYIINDIVEANSDLISIGDWEPVNPKTVGQYTGVKDKHGREIYEGDLLKSGEVTVEVVFSDYAFKLVSQSEFIPGAAKVYNMTFATQASFEVIDQMEENK